ncbi:hypothetical protein [Rhizobium leguminosarum]|uniref:hypothetical protein n=1 Tax=Rhizobium leguminosarum TaxID=384 RepID=UPI00103C3868|nr:hypothetical protein [Rhizobium leguminosarum]MBY5788088.1 hypothetical protein [Rhizobium leguminosarum]MBY5795570.1 hypothetical protein [Rhizobium leguminosarum]TBZ21619.1 hypothetical protein E0H33_03765 [Rhizobium leguminosarum bv. viciae]
MGETDYSTLKGVAEEKHFDVCVSRFQGERVDSLITRKGVKKADYLFRDAGVVAELKVLETEFAQTPEAGKKLADIKARCIDLNEEDAAKLMFRGAFEILRAPLQRIIKKANTQIRETKQELGLTGFEGVLLCVNDNYKGIPPAIVLALISDILAGTHFRSIRAAVYLTNHYIEHPDSPDALLLWHPLYSPLASDGLQEFINNFGRAWFDYSEEQLGPFTSRTEQETLDLLPASVVSGVYRNERYIAPSNE